MPLGPLLGQLGQVHGQLVRKVAWASDQLALVAFSSLVSTPTIGWRLRPLAGGSAFGWRLEHFCQAATQVWKLATAFLYR